MPEAQGEILARIDERTKNTERKVDDLKDAQTAMSRRMDEHFVTRDALQVVDGRVTAMAMQLGQTQAGLTNLSNTVANDYATCERVSSLEDGLFQAETAANLRSLVEGEDLDKRAVTRGEYSLVRKIVFGTCGVVLMAVLTALVALVVMHK